MREYLIKNVFPQAIAVVALSFFVGLALNAVRPDGIRLIDHYSSDVKNSMDYGGVKTVALPEALRLHKTHSAVFVDARSQEEYEEGHIPGAVSMPLYDADRYIHTFRERISAASAIITYCDGEYCHLSADLALFLKKQGYNNVRIFVNGWGVWQRRGYAVERGVSGNKSASGGS